MGEFSQVFIGHFAFRLSHLNSQLLFMVTVGPFKVKQNLETNLAGNSNVGVFLEKPCDTQTHEEIKPRQKNGTTDEYI